MTSMATMSTYNFDGWDVSVVITKASLAMNSGP